MRDRPSFQTYYALLERGLSEYLDKQTADYLLGVDQVEYLDYLYEQFKWLPLEIRMDGDDR